MRLRGTLPREHSIRLIVGCVTQDNKVRYIRVYLPVFVEEFVNIRLTLKQSHVACSAVIKVLSQQRIDFSQFRLKEILLMNNVLTVDEKSVRLVGENLMTFSLIYDPSSADCSQLRDQPKTPRIGQEHITLVNNLLDAKDQSFFWTERASVEGHLKEAENYFMATSKLGPNTRELDVVDMNIFWEYQNVAGFNSFRDYLNVNVFGSFKEMMSPSGASSKISPIETRLIHPEEVTHDFNKEQVCLVKMKYRFTNRWSREPVTFKAVARASGAQTMSLAGQTAFIIKDLALSKVTEREVSLLFFKAGNYNLNVLEVLLYEDSLGNAAQPTDFEAKRRTFEAPDNLFVLKITQR